MATEYQAYLIRLQRNNSGDPWRTIVQNPHTGEILRFANEHEMLRYLMQVLANGSIALGQDTESKNPQRL